MSDVVLLENAARDLKGVLAQLALGETVKLADAQGKPVALLVSLNDAAQPSATNADWQKQWEALAQAVSAAIPDGPSLVDTLIEMRR